MGLKLLWNGRPIGIQRPISLQRPTSAQRAVSSDRRVAIAYPHPPNYDELFTYQRVGVDWLRSRRKGLLSDEMGLGKSAQVLRALPRRARVIVVCPGFLRSVWAEQCERWRPDLRTLVNLPGAFELPSESGGDVSIVSYESLPDFPEQSKGRQKQLFPQARLSDVHLVVDELHYCKNYKALRTEKVKALARQCGRAWGLTGSPLPDHPFDLWGTLDAIGLAREAFGSWEAFLDTFRAKKNFWGGYEFDLPEADVRAMLAKVSLRRKRADVAPELPPKVFQYLPVDAPSEVMVMLDGIAERWSGDGNDLPPFELMSAVRAALARSRILALLDHAARYEEEQIPLVVFSAHKEPVLAIGQRPGWAVVTGETPRDERDSAVADFQAGKLKGIAGTIAAMGVGLTLTHASHLLFVDRSWTPGDNEQAEDRLVRHGQKASSVNVSIMVSDHPVDKRILEINEQKRTMIHRVVG